MKRQTTINSRISPSHLRAIKETLRNIPSCDEYHVVVSIESIFRPLLFRLAEYGWLFVLLTVNSPRACALTIGRNQLRYDLWLSYLASINSEPRLVAILRSCEGIHEAKAATEWFLTSRGFYGGINQSVSKLYTGRKNYYYDRLFVESGNLLRKKRAPLHSRQSSLRSRGNKWAMTRQSFLKIFIWLFSLPFFFAAWICHRFNILNVRNELIKCRSILAQCAHHEISEDLYNVLRLAEDHRNALHFGVDPIAICRAIWRNLTQGGFEGASTIEQQFVRSCTGQYERTLKRKFREQMIAVKLNRLATKRAISTAFISTAHYGDLHRGPLSILRRSGRLPSTATLFESANLVARIKFPEPSPISAAWTNHFETRVRYLLRLLLTYSEGRGRQKKEPFQTSYLLN